MSQPLCFETICVKNRLIQNIAYHQARLNKTRAELFGLHDKWELSEIISIPNFVDNEPHKCRLAYADQIDNIKWERYIPRTIRKIRKVYDDTIDYSYKYNDRTALNSLYEQREDADEILIIKNGKVSDTLYCNVAFLKDGRWYTPDTPLLPGTQRAFLLDSGIIEEAEISENDIQAFDQIRLFNAMVSWENAAILEVKVIQ
ncbi:aminotransferase class IV [Dyadobacter sp. CY345]|uniref:aminotransferase class IV n=1 Tax=Dyadobacter sp. CY345 TaxID=2909335 RepID=UPI001F1CB416|nr:aminotransferase class IV [Dyadobacter sp. CY345]MCF2446169.1 aminotransferase class IV [Dyadobacter sp. CY345]